MATRTRFESGGGPVFTVTLICYLESQFTSTKPSTDDPKARPASTAAGLGGEACPHAAFDSAAVIARRIAASVALSSQRTLIPSDWTPSCDQTVARSTLTGWSFIFA